MFDIKEEAEIEPQCIATLMEQLDVFISIKPKPKQPSKVTYDLMDTHTHTGNVLNLQYEVYIKHGYH